MGIPDPIHKYFHNHPISPFAIPRFSTSKIILIRRWVSQPLTHLFHPFLSRPPVPPSRASGSSRLLRWLLHTCRSGRTGIYGCEESPKYWYLWVLIHSQLRTSVNWYTQGRVFDALGLRRLPRYTYIIKCFVSDNLILTFNICKGIYLRKIPAHRSDARRLYCHMHTTALSSCLAALATQKTSRTRA